MSLSKKIFLALSLGFILGSLFNYLNFFEEKLLLEPVEYSYKNDRGEIKKERRVIEKCTGQRKEDEKRTGRLQKRGCTQLDAGINSRAAGGWCLAIACAARR